MLSQQPKAYLTHTLRLPHVPDKDMAVQES